MRAVTPASAIPFVSFGLYLSIAIFACSRPQLKVLPVSLPDLSRVDEPVKAQVRERYVSLTQ